MRHHKTGPDHWAPKGRSGYTPEQIRGPIERDDGPLRGIIYGLPVSMLLWLVIGLVAVWRMW